MQGQIESEGLLLFGKSHICGVIAACFMAIALVFAPSVAFASHPTSTDESGISFLKDQEGFIETAKKVLSTETHLTIGYGHYGSDVKDGMTITKAEADVLLRKDLVEYEKYLNEFLDSYGISINQNQYNALISFT